MRNPISSFHIIIHSFHSSAHFWDKWSLWICQANLPSSSASLVLILQVLLFARFSNSPFEQLYQRFYFASLPLYVSYILKIKLQKGNALLLDILIQWTYFRVQGSKRHLALLSLWCVQFPECNKLLLWLLTWSKSPFSKYDSEPWHLRTKYFAVIILAINAFRCANIPTLVKTDRNKFS